MTVGKTPPPWCEVMLAYGRLRGESEATRIAAHLAPSDSGSLKTFARTLDCLPEESALTVCRRILEFAGLSFSEKRQ